MHVVWDGKTDLLLRNVKDYYKKYTSSRVAAALPYLGKRMDASEMPNAWEIWASRATLTRRHDNSQFL